jgi:hypothetical protein
VCWLHRLVDLGRRHRPPDGRIVVLVEGPEGLSRIRARWCVGADGASSTVRRLLDVPFEGVTDDATFWVADLRGVSRLRDDAIAVRFDDATFAVSLPLGPGGHTRLIALATGEHVSQEAALSAARSDLGLSYAAVDCSRRTGSTTAPGDRDGCDHRASDCLDRLTHPVGEQRPPEQMVWALRVWRRAGLGTPRPCFDTTRTGPTGDGAALGARRPQDRVVRSGIRSGSAVTQ